MNCVVRTSWRWPAGSLGAGIGMHTTKKYYSPHVYPCIPLAVWLSGITQCSGSVDSVSIPGIRYTDCAPAERGMLRNAAERCYLFLLPCFHLFPRFFHNYSLSVTLIAWLFYLTFEQLFSLKTWRCSWQLLWNSGQKQLDKIGIVSPFALYFLAI